MYLSGLTGHEAGQPLINDNEGNTMNDIEYANEIRDELFNLREKAIAHAMKTSGQGNNATLVLCRMEISATGERRHEIYRRKCSRAALELLWAAGLIVRVVHGSNGREWSEFHQSEDTPAVSFNPYKLPYYSQEVVTTIETN